MAATALRAGESFTVGAEGRYVGEDGFHVPKDFREFFERDPMRVRRPALAEKTTRREVRGGRDPGPRMGSTPVSLLALTGQPVPAKGDQRKTGRVCGRHPVL